ncbi:MAG TPA: LicD family protein [Treponemataceae bacterium]|nr:LicD family protein [Treponemataceae bacterium]
MARDFVIKNPEALLENMVLMQEILSKNKIVCFLYYGTLLGAIREKGFIPHDDDADIGIFDTDFDRVLTLIPTIVAAGFLFKSLRHGTTLQFIRNDEQLDIYQAVHVWRPFGYRWTIDERLTVKGKHLDTLQKIDFLGHSFFIPSEPVKLLQILYGKTWKTPMKNIPTKTGWLWKFKKIKKAPFKIIYYANRYFKMQNIKNNGK